MPSDSSVEFYAFAVASVPVWYSHGICDCGHCSRAHRRDGFRSYRCDLLDRSIIEPEDLDKRLPDCPAELDELPF